MRYFEPKTGNVFTARFADCHFNQAIFPTLAEEMKQLEKKITWSELFLFHLDPHTKNNVS